MSARVLSIAILLIVPLAPHLFADITLVSNGKADCVIVVAPDAPPAIRRGAMEIQTHVKQMTGVEIPIVNTKQDGKRGIFVGLAPAAESTVQFPGEGCVLGAHGGNILIMAASPRGAMYGCTAFLEKLGVRWYTPKVTHVPKRDTLVVPDMNETHAPAFEYREPFFFEAFDKDWAARLRINGHHAALDDTTGGHVIYGRFAHTFEELVPPGLFDAHPKYFPLIDGKRTGGYVQRCLTNPDVLAMCIAGVKRWIHENPQATIFSVTQNDTKKFCECDRCVEIERQFGGVHSGVYLWFVNQVAEAIEKDHPDKLIDTFAYQFTETPPTGIVPRPNVRVRLCPIACCEAHPYEQCSAEQNREFMQHLRGWSKLTDTLYIWHYCTNFAHYLMPFPDFDQFPADARLYRKLGVKGIFFQGAYAPGGGGSDSELRAYVMAKLLWDPQVDTDALVNEWMSGVYGPAAKPMRDWFDLLHAQVRKPDAHFFIYDAPSKVPYLGPDVIAQGDRLYDEAERLAREDPVASEYVAKSRLGLRYVKLMLKPDTGAALDQFLADVREFGITQLREGRDLAEWEKRYRAAAAKR